MVDRSHVEKQLKKLNFNIHGWGRSEARELPGILLDHEEIFELVNGIYEGGFALLVATNVRVLLVDKKPLNYLTVEDFRFDMISEIDYSHRLIGARISISTGSKNLQFTSYNQQRLRKLINHVQHAMAEMKKKQNEHQEDQKSHLEQINQQLQAYLIAQHKQQLELEKKLSQSHGKQDVEIPTPVKPSPELSDFLFAQSLLAQYKAEHPEAPVKPVDLPEGLDLPLQVASSEPVSNATPTNNNPSIESSNTQTAELYAEGLHEVFGKHRQQQPKDGKTERHHLASPISWLSMPPVSGNPLEINPLRIAYSKLPMAMRNRKFGRPSFHAHSQQDLDSSPQPSPAQA